MHLSARPSACIWYAAATIAGAALGRVSGSTRRGVWLSVAVNAGHLVCLAAHHAGHAAAAGRTDCPIRGVRLWGPLANDLYSPEEAALPDAQRVRIALAGPAASGLLTLVLFALDGASRDRSPLTRVVVRLVALDNLLVFFLGAFMPLSFTDGGVLVRTWRSRQRR